jgi:arabinoxylan arabinofuranohydrolase
VCSPGLATACSGQRITNPHAQHAESRPLQGRSLAPASLRALSGRSLSWQTAVSALLSVVLHTSSAEADNPIIQHAYTADPAPMVYQDAVYLCTSHDEDVTVNNFFTMNDWFVFSTKDMVNWTDHGSPLSYESFSWATGKAWAPQCIERNGKFYFYVPVSDAIGVAVADSPLGPFTDPLGKPLVAGSYQYIDPTVFIDDDGQAYLYFGNPRLWYVKLNADMISYSGKVEQIPNSTDAFGQRNGVADRPTLYEEGPWFYKRNDLYYMMFAASGIPEDIAYSTSPGPTGPWSYRGIIMPNRAGHAFTNHAGVVDFKGGSYFFYHTQELNGGGGFKRSTAVEKFTYNADGSFPTINKTSEGVTDAAEPLIPFYRIEGETMAWGSGVEVEDCSEGGRNLSHLDNGDYIKVEAVDFLTGATSFEASVASNGPGGTIELRLDETSGPVVGTCPVAPTGGWQTWQIVSCDVSSASGQHDLYLVFTGGGGPLFNLDWYQFTPLDPLPTGTGGAEGVGGAWSDSGGTGPFDEASAGGAIGVTGGTNQGEAASGGSTSPQIGPTGEPPDADAAGCSCTTSSRRTSVPWFWIIAGSLTLLARGRPAPRVRRGDSTRVSPH